MLKKVVPRSATVLLVMGATFIWAGLIRIATLDDQSRLSWGPLILGTAMLVAAYLILLAKDKG